MRCVKLSIKLLSLFQLQEIFPIYKECVYRVREPNASEVINFLKPVIAEALLDPPPVENNEPPPPLPIGMCNGIFFTLHKKIYYAFLVIIFSILIVADISFKYKLNRLKI